MVQQKLFSYELAMNSTAYFKDGIRKGYFLLLEEEDGSFGVGEIASLKVVHGDSKSPFHFAHSMALNHLQLKKQAELNYASKNLVLSDLFDEKDRGFLTIKIKVGQLSIKDEIKRIKSIRALVGKSVNIRLDANKRLDFIQACMLLAGCHQENIEYIEEPLSDISYTKKLIHETGVDVALDESFIDINDLLKLSDFGVKYLVLKPSRFNSFIDLENIVNNAKSLNIKPILSTCFESEYFCAWSILVAANLDLLSYAHGIFMPQLFKRGVFLEPLSVINGRVLINDVVQRIYSFDPRKHEWIKQV